MPLTVDGLQVFLNGSVQHRQMYDTAMSVYSPLAANAVNRSFPSLSFHMNANIIHLQEFFLYRMPCLLCEILQEKEKHSIWTTASNRA